MANKTEHNKKALLSALRNSLGIVTQACEEVNIGRTTYYEYLKTDPEFKKAVEDLSNVALDFAESKLLLEIKEQNITAIIFYLKTKGKKRGYSERVEIDTSDVRRAIADVFPKIDGTGKD